MDTFVLLMLLVLLGGALLVLLALVRYRTRRTPTSTQAPATRSVVYLVSGMHLLVMQQTRKGRFRLRIEVPKGKVMRGESALAAAYRECWEESGLRPTDLQFFASFPTPQRSRNKQGIETWEAFWGTVPAGTSLPFTHRVGGKGRDRGRVYQYRLVPLETASVHPPLDVPLPALRRALEDTND